MSSSLTANETPVRFLKGVGPKRALALERLGVRSVRDLFYLFPKRYEDRGNFCKIADAAPGQTVTLRGEILSSQFKPIRRMPIVEIVIGDGDGMIPALWFNQPYLRNQFQEGQQVILYGKIEWYQNRIQMVSPEYEIVEEGEESIHTGRITPVYNLTEGLFQRSLRTTLKEAIENRLDQTISDPLPEPFRESKKLMELREALREIHFPSSSEQLEAARRRLVHDEFFIFELLLLKQLQAMRTKHSAIRLTSGPACFEDFSKHLPFQLTASQKTAVRDIYKDLEREIPMNRLLHGDVGSGKTVVAASAILLAAKNRYQSAVLVPTEILAEQHFRSLSKLLEPFGVSIKFLTSSISGDDRDRLRAQLRRGEISVLVGTHALLQEDIRFASLALVVTDEQHKFGVYQRSKLLRSEPRPHQLIMTATPIPRTLALTVYGDLDISVIKELPKGRQPIKTFWVTREKQTEILKRILEKIKREEKAYFIFPLIEESEKTDLLAAKREYGELRKGIFSSVKIGLVHGRLKPEERQAVMAAFRRGEVRVLVATSVIEVGVDDPDATMMVIENAERFGLAQLHQMRGRIGRGSKPSECFLFGEPKTTEGRKRLRILTKTQDGFVIAEEDLALRGPGDIWGTRQSGEPLFRMADPIRDYPLLVDARDSAVKLIQGGALESSAEWEGMKQFLEYRPLNY